MPDFIEILKTLLLGIVEGITEWLPISSTGHMILVDEFVRMDISPAFRELFLYMIQLGAIAAVVILFRKRMWPFQAKDRSKPFVKTDIIILWLKVAFACIPGFLAFMLFDFVDNVYVVAGALIVYGVIFILMENRNGGKTPRVDSLSDISFRDAFIIGIFQMLSIIPGTSRSGSTIIGGLAIGLSRVAVTEFTFFLAVPVMIGVSFIKLLKYGFSFSSAELMILAVGCLSAFVTSLLVIRFLMNYVRKHDFKVFGWYRVVLGAVLIAYFALIR